MESSVNRDNVRLWVEALESDEFLQGRGYLTQRKDGQDYHCCLGVACIVAMRHGVELNAKLQVHDFSNVPVTIDHAEIAESSRDGVVDGANTVMYDGEASFLPMKMQRWLGMNVAEGALTVDTEEGSDLSPVTLNDSLKWSFKEIAAALRTTYLSDV